MIGSLRVCSHWSGFDLPGRELGEAEVTGYARACWPSGTDAEIEFLAVQIATMTALDDAFEALTERPDPRTMGLLVPWRRRASSDLAAQGSLQLGSEWAGMRAALAALDARLARLTPGTLGRRRAVRSWWRRMAEQQIGAFAREATWRIDQAVPDLQTYVRVGQQSIGVEWTAATLIALDAASSVPRPAAALSKVIDAIARAIRLANDLHDPERERLEGKVQWTLLRSRDLVSREGLAIQDAEIVAARELKALAADEAALARSMLRGQQQSRLVRSDALRAGLAGLLNIGLMTYVPELGLAA
jgi:hypothetical protein